MSTPDPRRPCLLLTRPQAASARFAAACADLPVRIVIAPLQRIVPVPHDPAPIAQAEALGNQAQRKKLYNEWQQLFAKNLPVILIVKPDSVAAFQSRIGNYYVKDNAVISSNYTVFEK